MSPAFGSTMSQVPLGARAFRMCRAAPPSGSPIVMQAVECCHEVVPPEPVKVCAGATSKVMRSTTSASAARFRPVGWIRPAVRAADARSSVRLRRGRPQLARAIDRVKGCPPGPGRLPSRLRPRCPQPGDPQQGQTRCRWKQVEHRRAFRRTVRLVNRLRGSDSAP